MADAKASKADAIRRLREEQWDRRQAANAPKAKPAKKKAKKKRRRAKGLRLP